MLLLNLLQPLPISPLNPLNNFGLLVTTLRHVQQVIEVFNKLPLNITRHQSNPSLTKELDFAEEQTMILVGQPVPVFSQCGLAQCAINVPVLVSMMLIRDGLSMLTSVV